MLDPQMRANAILQLRARERGGAWGSGHYEMGFCAKGRLREWAEMLYASSVNFMRVCAGWRK
jgi:hypothetical protein